MDLLVLGGTRFVGRHLVEAALSRGHTVTLFNRGESNPDLFPAVTWLKGDRDGDLTSLDGGRWDAVVDTCGYVPRVVQASVERLADRVGCYAFISTISVYDLQNVGLERPDEEWRLGTLEDDTVEEITGATYGPLKVLCERAVNNGIGDRALIIRPGLIVGPYDPTDRFTYWPARFSRPGPVAAPGGPDSPVQFIDARDLGEWTIRLLEAGTKGVFNATGPVEPHRLGAVLESCATASGSVGAVEWIDESVLTDHEVQPFSEMPLWVPAENTAIMSLDVSRAAGAGLTLRPLDQTVRETLAWHEQRPADHVMKAGLTAEREALLLAAVTP